MSSAKYFAFDGSDQNLGPIIDPLGTKCFVTFKFLFNIITSDYLWIYYFGDADQFSEIVIWSFIAVNKGLPC